MNNVKTWTIKVLVNLDFLKQIKGSEKGTWENPLGAYTHQSLFDKSIRFIGASDSDPMMYFGDVETFNLPVSSGDYIQWIVEPVNTVNQGKEGVVLYGFKKGDNWDEYLTFPGQNYPQNHSFELIQGFNSNSKPSGSYLIENACEIGVPNTNVKETTGQNIEVSYHLKMLLLSYVEGKEPQVIKFIQFDPKFTINKTS